VWFFHHVVLLPFYPRIKDAFYTWCMQNSCINFVVYWCIFQYIKMLLDVIIMFCIDYRDFLSILLILVITRQDRKNPILRIWRFRDLSELKLTWDFSDVNILSREASRDQEVNEGATRPKQD
jgi:hypothetical protein